MPLFVFAQQGCCSSHGGIWHCDTNTGMYMCADGELSKSCECVYISERVHDTRPEFPYNINIERFTFDLTNNKKYSVFLDWEDIEDIHPREYSIRIGKHLADPGPLADTTDSEYTFHNVSPGTYYVSLKTKVRGVWSRYIYWDDVVVPDLNVATTPATEATSNISQTRLLTTGVGAVETQYPQEESSTHKTIMWIDLIALLILVSGVAFILYWFGWIAYRFYKESQGKIDTKEQFTTSEMLHTGVGVMTITFSMAFLYIFIVGTVSPFFGLISIIPLIILIFIYGDMLAWIMFAVVISALHITNNYFTHLQFFEDAIKNILY